MVKIRQNVKSRKKMLQLFVFSLENKSTVHDAYFV